MGQVLQGQERRVDSSCGAEISYAGFWKRVAATMIDGSILTVLGAVLGFNEALNLIAAWLYHAFTESSPHQATLGKRLLRIKVTDLQGERISFATASWRYFGMFVSALLLGLGFVMAGFTAQKQALHDIMARCLVVNADPNDPLYRD